VNTPEFLSPTPPYSCHTRYWFHIWISNALYQKETNITFNTESVCMKINSATCFYILQTTKNKHTLLQALINNFSTNYKHNQLHLYQQEYFHVKSRREQTTFHQSHNLILWNKRKLMLTNEHQMVQIKIKSTLETLKKTTALVSC